VTRRFRLFTDEHVPNSVVELLRREGWEVQRVLDLLGKGTDDRDIFPYADRACGGTPSPMDWRTGAGHRRSKPPATSITG